MVMKNLFTAILLVFIIGCNNKSSSNSVTTTSPINEHLLTEGNLIDSEIRHDIIDKFSDTSLKNYLKEVIDTFISKSNDVNRVINGTYTGKFQEDANTLYKVVNVKDGKFIGITFVVPKNQSFASINLSQFNLYKFDKSLFIKKANNMGPIMFSMVEGYVKVHTLNYECDITQTNNAFFADLIIRGTEANYGRLSISNDKKIEFTSSLYTGIENNL